MGKKSLDSQNTHPVEPDRNLHLGGRSFYFFDFDENIAFLATPSFLYHRETGQEVEVSNQEFMLHREDIGKRGPWRDYEVRLDPDGSFRFFRDQDHHEVVKASGRQRFVEDLAQALGHPHFNWQGPSWRSFHHAVRNQRPLSLITARGHHPETLKEGFSLLVKEGHLPREPNYLSLFPVSHPEVEEHLRAGEVYLDIPELKRRAFRASVERAIEIYGANEYHRFGMSDDDPKNIESVLAEMAEIKRQFPKMGFFVIDTNGGKEQMREVL